MYAQIKLCPCVRAYVRTSTSLSAGFVNFFYHLCHSAYRPANRFTNFSELLCRTTSEMTHLALKIHESPSNSCRRTDVYGDLRRKHCWSSIFGLSQRGICETAAGSRRERPPPRNSRGIALSILCGSYRESVLCQCAGGRFAAGPWSSFPPNFSRKNNEIENFERSLVHNRMHRFV